MTSFHGRSIRLSLAVDSIEKHAHHPKRKCADRFEFEMECLDGQAEREEMQEQRPGLCSGSVAQPQPSAGNNGHRNCVTRDGRQDRRVDDMADLARRCRRGRVMMM